MTKLYQLARRRLIDSLYGYHFSEHSFEVLEQRLLANPSDMVSNKLLMRLTMQIANTKKVASPDDLNGVVRDFQAFTNYCIYTDQDGKHITRFLYHVEAAKWEAGYHVPRNMVDFLGLTLAAHRKIDTFFEAEAKARARAFKQLEARLKKLGIDEHEMGEPDIELHQTLSSISHHILDWYLQIAPFNAYRQSAVKLAATAIAIMKRTNECATGYALGITIKELAQFGGWAGPSSLASSIESAFYYVIYGVVDHRLLIIDPRALPDNWWQRLREVAPALPKSQRFE